MMKSMSDDSHLKTTGVPYLLKIEQRSNEYSCRFGALEFCGDTPCDVASQMVEAVAEVMNHLFTAAEAREKGTAAGVMHGVRQALCDTMQDIEHAHQVAHARAAVVSAAPHDVN